MKPLQQASQDTIVRYPICCSPSPSSTARTSASPTSSGTSPHTARCFAFDTRFHSRLRAHRERAPAPAPLRTARSRTSRPPSTSGSRWRAGSGSTSSPSRGAVRRRRDAERISVTNNEADAARLRARGRARGRLADILSVKEHDFTLGDPSQAHRCTSARRARARRGRRPALPRCKRGVRRPHPRRRHAERRADGAAARYSGSRSTRRTWSCRIEVFASEERGEAGPAEPETHFGPGARPRRELAPRLEAACARAPSRVGASRGDLRRSVADLASLRMGTSAASPVSFPRPECPGS